jgi:hypothetical protein
MNRDHGQTGARPGVNVPSVHDHVNFSASHPTAFHDRVEFAAAFDGFFT